MASKAAKAPEKSELQFVLELLPDSCLTFYRRLCVVLAAVVTYFGVLVCVYQAIQNLSKSERQQTRENLCWSGVLSGRSGLLPAHSMTPKETCIRRKSEIKVLFRHEGLSALSEDGYDLFQVSCAYFQGFSLALRDLKCI